MHPEATSESETIASVANNMQESTDSERQHSRTHSMHVPLNLVSLTTGRLHSLGTTLGKLALGTVSDLMLMIEGKITEGGCNPDNVQALSPISTEDSCISLRDHKVFFFQ